MYIWKTTIHKMNMLTKNKTKAGGDKINPSSSANNFPVVDVGEPGGGLDAFKQLLKAIPVNSGMACVPV